MTKKEFKELTSYHRYRGGSRDNGINALFFGWREIEIDGITYRGFSHCLYGRAVNVTKKELETYLYGIVTGKINYFTEVPYYFELTAAPTDKQRFKAPISASGLNRMF